MCGGQRPASGVGPRFLCLRQDFTVNVAVKLAMNFWGLPWCCLPSQVADKCLALCGCRGSELTASSLDNKHFPIEPCPGSHISHLNLSINEDKNNLRTSR